MTTLVASAISRYPVPTLEELPDDIRARIVEVQEKAGFVPNGTLRPLRSVHTTWSTPCERSKRLMSDSVPSDSMTEYPVEHATGIALTRIANKRLSNDRSD